MFPRLRVLNGEIVTFQDIDLAEVLYKQRVQLKLQTEQAALMHCRTKIPP